VQSWGAIKFCFLNFILESWERILFGGDIPRFGADGKKQFMRVVSNYRPSFCSFFWRYPVARKQIISSI
jgi:hypothetical protein